MLAFLLVLALKTIQDNLGQVFTPNTCLLRMTSTSAVIAVLYGGSAGTSLMALKNIYRFQGVLSNVQDPSRRDRAQLWFHLRVIDFAIPYSFVGFWQDSIKISKNI
jgi:hypothetical protein